MTSTERREHNRKCSLGLLDANQVPYEILDTYNHTPKHVLVGGRIDFWPGTGLWIDQSNPKSRRRGVKALIIYLKEKEVDKDEA